MSSHMSISKEIARTPLIERSNGRNTQPRKLHHVYGKKAKSNSTASLLASFNQLTLNDHPSTVKKNLRFDGDAVGGRPEKENHDVRKKPAEKSTKPTPVTPVATPIENATSLKDKGTNIEGSPKYHKKHIRTDVARKQASRTSNEDESPHESSNSAQEFSQIAKKHISTRRKASRKSIERRGSLSPLTPASRDAQLPQVSQYLQPLVRLSNLGFRSSSCFGEGFPKHLILSQIASGSFGEVFILTKSKSQQRPIVWTAPAVCAVFKVIPLNAEKGKGSRKYSKVDDVVSEVKISLRMDEISGFLRFRDVHVVQGPFPRCLRDAAEEYRGTTHTHESPDWRTFSEDQVFAIIEMDYAGRQLENILRDGPSVQLIYDIFWLVASTLALGERNAHFEHRDLHISNICIRSRRPTTEPSPTTSSNPATFGAANVGITIIDFTYSRTNLTGDVDDKTSVAATEMKDTWFRGRKASNEQEQLQNDAYERYVIHFLSRRQDEHH